MKRVLVVLVSVIISALVMAVPAMAVTTIADYESNALTPNNLGGNVGTMSGDGAHDPVAAIVTPAEQGTYALKLTYNNVMSSTWSGLWQYLNSTQGNPYDASSFATLRFWAKGQAGGETFKVELQDGSQTVAITLASLSGFTSGLTTGWQEVVIPLTSFTGLNRAHLTQLNYVVDAAGTGTFYIDNARFAEASVGGSTSTVTLVFANYESGAVSPDNLGGGVGGMSPDANDPVISVVSSPVSEGTKALAIAYKYSAGQWNGMWQQTTAAAGPYDVSSYDTFRLMVAGKTGGEKFKIELKDTAGGIFDKNITEIAGFSNGLTTAYQELAIPLSSFTGVDMTKLKEVNYVFDQLPNGCTIYLDNVRFTGAGTGGTGGGTTVTVIVKNYTIAVNVTGTVDLGQLIVGATGYSSTAVTVQNSGNSKESFWLSIANPSGWTSAASQGNNQFTLSGEFGASGGSSFLWSAANDLLTTTPAESSATRFAGSQSGFGVDINASRNLWFAFGAPTKTTVETSQVIPITITATIEP